MGVVVSRFGPLISGGRADRLVVAAFTVAVAAVVAAATPPLRRGIQRAVGR
jgi:hypothetical protein